MRLPFTTDATCTDNTARASLNAIRGHTDMLIYEHARHTMHDTRCAAAQRTRARGHAAAHRADIEEWIAQWLSACADSSPTSSAPAIALCGASDACATIADSIASSRAIIFGM